MGMHDNDEHSSILPTPSMALLTEQDREDAIRMLHEVAAKIKTIGLDGYGEENALEMMFSFNPPARKASMDNLVNLIKSQQRGGTYDASYTAQYDIERANHDGYLLKVWLKK